MIPLPLWLKRCVCTCAENTDRISHTCPIGFSRASGAMVTNVGEAKILINEALQEQLASGGILHTQLNLQRIGLEEYLKKQCDVGGIVHNLMNKPKDNHDGMRGVAKMMMNKGDKLLPEKFDNEVRTGVLFRHWSSEMRQYLNVIDKDMLVYS